MSVGLRQLVEPEEVHASMADLAGAFRGTYPTYDDWRERITPDILSGQRQLFEIERGDRPCGLFLIHLLPPPAVKANALFIHPTDRREGAATSAYLLLLKRLARIRRVIVTQVKSGNLVARRLVEDVGFVHVGRLEHLVEGANDNEVYARHLRADETADSLTDVAAAAYDDPGRKVFIRAGSHA